MLLPALLGLVSAPAVAAPGGPLDVLPHGKYLCEEPGSALAGAGVRKPSEDFRTLSNSSYRQGEAGGTYLLTGDTVLMTGGPLKGRRYHRISDNFLRAMNPDGSDATLRCVRGFTGHD